MAEGRTQAGHARLDTVDMLRGLVIAIMVIDHVRDFFHLDALRFDPTNPALTTPALFLTRWITHLCAPTFVFLAGASIWFQRANGKDMGDLTRLLITRGIWLILLEITVISFGFNMGSPLLFLQVIWVIGWSMILMAAMIRLPENIVLVIGAMLILGYQLLIPITEGLTGPAAVMRHFLVVPGILDAGIPVFVFYVIVPWFGMMCLGYGLGRIFLKDRATRNRNIFKLALLLIGLFLVIRVVNGYGEQVPWKTWPTYWQTAVSFMNISKYPPSPAFLSVTLGVSLLLYLALEHLKGPIARVLLDFGRTPFLTYIAHVYVAHGLLLAAVIATGAPLNRAFNLVTNVLLAKGGDWGLSLGGTWAVWAVVIAILIPLARRFAHMKRTRRDWWLSYL